MAQHIVVTNYNPLWKDMFETEATAIKKILGDNCIAIHHIGGTSGPMSILWTKKVEILC